MVKNVKLKIQQVIEDLPWSLASELAFKYTLLTWAIRGLWRSPSGNLQTYLLVPFVILGSIYLLWVLANPSIKLDWRTVWSLFWPSSCIPLAGTQWKYLFYAWPLLASLWVWTGSSEAESGQIKWNGPPEGVCWLGIFSASVSVAGRKSPMPVISSKAFPASSTLSCPHQGLHPLLPALHAKSVLPVQR